MIGESKNVLLVFLSFEFVEKLFANKRFVVYYILVIAINEFKLKTLFVATDIVIIEILITHILNNFDACVAVYSIIEYIDHSLHSSFRTKQHQLLKI